MASLISNSSRLQLKLVSFNMHGFNQGSSVLHELIDGESPDLFLLQEHWMTPANMYKFDEEFPYYSSFGRSAMTDRVKSGMLIDRPFGGVIILIHKRIRDTVQTIHCDDRFAIVKVSNYLVVSVYLPCSGVVDRLSICDELLAEIGSYCDLNANCECIIAGDFNVDLIVLIHLVAIACL